MNDVAVFPEIAPVIPEIAQQLSGIHAKYIKKFYFNFFTGSRIFFLRIQEKFREDVVCCRFCHPGNRIAIIRGPCFYMLIKLRILAWIPDIFPEIQEKFREDGNIIHSCNKAFRDHPVLAKTRGIVIPDFF